MQTLVTNFITWSRQILFGIQALRALRLSMLRKVFSLMHRREKIALITLGVAAIASIFFSFNSWYMTHTDPVPSNGGTYREGIIGQPRFINPLLATSDVDTALVHLVFSGLYRYDEAGMVIPDLAEALPQISEDQKQYTITLKTNSRWHNGEPVTAEDVLFTIETLQNPAYNSPLRGEWLNTTVEKIGEHTVVFILKDASSPFIHNLTLPIVSKKIWSSVSPEDFVKSNGNVEAVGNGPYAIKEVRKVSQGAVQSILLQSFGDFHNGRAYINKVQLNFYDTPENLLTAVHGKQIDGFGFSPFENSIRLDRSSGALTIRQIPLAQYQAVFFNLHHVAFKDPAVRKALTTATNVDGLINDIYNGNGRRLAGPVIPEQVGGVTTTASQYNIEEAKRILDAAGWIVSPQTGFRAKRSMQLQFTLSTNEFPLNSQVAQALMEQWKPLNINIQLNIQPTKELNENVIRPRAFDALLFAQKLGTDPDPFIFWHSSQAKNPGLNITGYNNQTTDKLINEARTATDPVVRNEKYRQFNTLVVQDAPAIFIAQNIYSYALDSNIQGLSLTSLADENLRFYNLPGWYINTSRSWKK